MDLKIFDVEHGACALLACEDQTRLMIDCGHNATTQWRPGTYLRQSGITFLDMLAITNYDEDHASGARNLFDNVDVGWLWRNSSVSPDAVRHLKSEDGMGPGIDRLVTEIETGFSGPPTTAPRPSFQGLVRQAFCNRYPADFDDENNLSMIVHLNCHGVGVLFPGDLEAAGWRELLKQTAFQAALKSTHVLVAPHHGRESGCCDEIFDLCRPYFIVISDKGYQYDTQQTASYYRQRARGGVFRGETRRVLTTRNDGRIGFLFGPGNWAPY